MKRLNLKKYKNLLEGKILYFATTDKKAKPNLICVAGAKIIDNVILITDNYFNKTYKNLKQNKKVAIISNDRRQFLQFKGIAKYYDKGKYFGIVRKLPINKNYHPKGAVLIKVKEIYDLDPVRDIK